MQWASLVLGFVAAAMLVALSTAFLSSSPSATGQAAPTSGMAVIDSYACRPGETKHVTLRGIEDDYSKHNVERATPHPRLKGLPIWLPPNAANFDDTEQDAALVDYFEFSQNTVSAMVLVKVKPVGESANDDISLGDLASKLAGKPQRNARVYNDQFRRLLSSGRWKQSGDIYWASLADLPLYSGGTVLDFIQTSMDRQVVDFAISDDSSTDFVAAVACEKPTAAAGVTFTHLDTIAAATPGIAGFDCYAAAPDESDCKPYVGNRDCSNELPLLCYIDRQLPAPRHNHRDPTLISRSWSGGEVAATAPIRGDAFKTIADADRHCAAQFGQGWRVAEWHLGGRGAGFAAKSGGRKFSGHHWIDIRGAPYGTCWRRDDEAK